MNATWKYMEIRLDLLKSVQLSQKHAIVMFVRQQVKVHVSLGQPHYEQVFMCVKGQVR